MAADILFLVNMPLSDSKMTCYGILRKKFGKKIDICSPEALTTKKTQRPSSILSPEMTFYQKTSPLSQKKF